MEFKIWIELRDRDKIEIEIKGLQDQRHNIGAKNSNRNLNSDSI